MISFTNPDDVFQPQLFSQLASVTGGTWLVTSGQVAFDTVGNVVGAGDLKRQAALAFENLSRVLGAAGADFTHVAKLTIYVVDLEPAAVAVVGDMLRQYVDVGNPPANTLLGVQALAHPELLIEVEAVAVLGHNT